MTKLIALLDAIFAFIERKRLKAKLAELEDDIEDLSDNVAESIANGGGVQHSDKTLDDLRSGQASDEPGIIG